MTLTGDFGSPIQDSPPPSYPTVFGVTFTPIVTGILIAVGGLLVAAYLGSILVAPKLEEATALQLELSQQEDDLKQREETLKQLNKVVADLDQAKVNNQQVRTLFADQKALDTLLLDLNQIITASQARLDKYEPQPPAVVADGSLGPELNNKIKQQVTNVIMEGSYEQTIKVMQSIDSQQNFLVVRGLTVEAIPTKPGLVKSTFNMIAYVPLTPEELAAANPPPEPKPEGEGQKDGQPKPEGT
ncbi:pilus assembly protein PilO [Thermosynechococcaceae cyanobacterium BACA0444]|uniref:Pilus assembly protein PilO n=1 Tax=Pseudocalidococcus azoricus BACA0444 TaxID=2918990 RepID=A0AAE4FTL3_9CYAN|nr:pilus assembly protein PilO [Pseudocalidococcus azoricus]MDS3862083.1 pilus assembly protein PilO [Pseudocalidococcus azoricus BACA0444]